MNQIKYVIEQDEDPQNPRKEFDNAGKMYCFHDRYNLGDKHDCSLLEVQALADDPDNVSLPLYLYDHSGITMRTSPFSCRWDSGQVGWIVMTKDEIDKEWNGDRKAAEKYLQACVEEYDQYLTGDVWGYRITAVDEDGDEVNELESCWGFYGKAYCEEQAKEVLESCIKRSLIQEEEDEIATLNVLEAIA